MKLDILVFGAHPDDVELGCGGTIIKEVQNGKRVGVIDLTRGELGTRGSVKIRDAESKKASQIMGISLRDNMDFSDGFFENTKKNKILLVEKIRNYQPDIVITNALSDRHPDHSRGAQIVIDACFLSGLIKIETEDNYSFLDLLKRHFPRTLAYFYNERPFLSFWKVCALANLWSPCGHCGDRQ